MSREKIDEIAEFGNDIYSNFQNITLRDSRDLAESLYNEGYRKQSEGEWVYYECVSSYDGAKSGYGCSRCGAFVDENIFETDEIHKEFCGSCGARMKGGAK